MHCGYGYNNQGIIEDNRRKKRTTSRDTARGAEKASTSEATEPICLRKDTRIVYESDTRTITRPLSRTAPFWNFRDSCNAARPSRKTSVVATSGNATATNVTTRSRNAATSRTKADGLPVLSYSASTVNHITPRSSTSYTPESRDAFHRPLFDSWFSAGSRLPHACSTRHIPEITRQCHYRYRACCRICGTCGGCRCREKPADQGA